MIMINLEFVLKSKEHKCTRRMVIYVILGALMVLLVLLITKNHIHKSIKIVNITSQLKLTFRNKEIISIFQEVVNIHSLQKYLKYLELNLIIEHKFDISIFIFFSSQLLFFNF